MYMLRYLDKENALKGMLMDKVALTTPLTKRDFKLSFSFLLRVLSFNVCHCTCNCY